jgi:hypothetical protein
MDSNPSPDFHRHFNDADHALRTSVIELDICLGELGIALEILSRAAKKLHDSKDKIIREVLTCP